MGKLGSGLTGNSLISFCFCFFLFFLFFVFLGRHPQHMEVPRLGVQSELQLLAYTTAMPDPQPTERGQGSNPHTHGY